MSAAELRAALAMLGLSQLEAARRLGVDGRTVRRWVAGHRRIPGPVVELVHTWLGRRHGETAAAAGRQTPLAG